MEKFYYEAKPIIWILAAGSALLITGVSFLKLALAFGLTLYAANILLVRRNYRRNQFRKPTFTQPADSVIPKYQGHDWQNRFKNSDKPPR